MGDNLVKDYEELIVGLYDKEKHEGDTEPPFMYVSQQRIWADGSKSGRGTLYAYSQEQLFYCLSLVLGTIPKTRANLKMQLPENIFVFTKAALEQMVKNHNCSTREN